LYLEDARSFTAKMALVKKYHFRGISVWRLGHEDPDVWKQLQQSRQN
jgi:spore germination protein